MEREQENINILFDNEYYFVFDDTNFRLSAVGLDCDKIIEIECANGKFKTTINQMLKKVHKSVGNNTFSYFLKGLFYSSGLCQNELKYTSQMAGTYFTLDSFGAISLEIDIGDDTACFDIDYYSFHINEAENFDYDQLEYVDGELVKEMIYWMTKENKRISFMYGNDELDNEKFYVDTDYVCDYSEKWIYNVIACAFPHVKFN